MLYWNTNHSSRGIWCSFFGGDVSHIVLELNSILSFLYQQNGRLSFAMVQWIKFWILALIWGSSFLLIKVAVDDLGAFPLVSIRLGLAALIFFVFLQWTGRKLPTTRREMMALLFVGVFNTAVPFALISWGETKIDSGLATILNATVPLFNLIFAHFILSDERLNTFKVVGLGVGFVGVIVLMSRGIGNNDNPVIGQLAVIGGAICYAVSVVVLRLYLRGFDPLATAGWSSIFGAVAIITATLVFIHPLPNVAEMEAKVILSALTLAIVNTVVAYFLFYDLIDKWGVRATLVTYAMPPIGVTLGVVILGEQVDWRLIVGGLLIVTGIVAAKLNGSPTFTLLRSRTLARKSLS